MKGYFLLPQFLFSGIFLLFLPLSALDNPQNGVQKMEKERQQTFQGGPTQEEKEYYRKVQPQNPEKDRDYLMKEHPLQEEPVPDQWKE